MIESARELGELREGLAILDSMGPGGRAFVTSDGLLVRPEPRLTSNAADRLQSLGWQANGEGWIYPLWTRP